MAMIRSSLLFVFFPFFVFLRSIQGANLDINEEHDRVLHVRPLSDKEHNIGEEDNHEYDHEAFLGGEAEEFDHLTPDESKRRLALMVNRIDKDKDGQVTVEELTEWIKYTQTRYIRDDVEEQWESYVKEGKDTINWGEYRQHVYGFLDEDSSENLSSYHKLETRDHRRWLLADVDKDGELNKVEFQTFLHPENTDHMRDIVVIETIEDIDKDGDEKINIDEYIDDIYRGEEVDDGHNEEPEWVVDERAQFVKFRDRNGDGVMDLEEVRAWIVPPDFDNYEGEARHLVYESDADHDNKLTRDEILDNYDLFVGSQATDFGEVLTRHEEF